MPKKEKFRGEHEMVAEHMKISKLIRETLEEAESLKKGPKRRGLLLKAKKSMLELMAIEDSVKPKRPESRKAGR